MLLGKTDSPACSPAKEIWSSNLTFLPISKFSILKLLSDIFEKNIPEDIKCRINWPKWKKVRKWTYKYSVVKCQQIISSLHSEFLKTKIFRHFGELTSWKFSDILRYICSNVICWLIWAWVHVPTFFHNAQVNSWHFPISPKYKYTRNF